MINKRRRFYYDFIRKGKQKVAFSVMGELAADVDRTSDCLREGQCAECFKVQCMQWPGIDDNIGRDLAYMEVRF